MHDRRSGRELVDGVRRDGALHALNRTNSVDRGVGLL